MLTVTLHFAHPIYIYVSSTLTVCFCSVDLVDIEFCYILSLIFIAHITFLHAIIIDLVMYRFSKCIVANDGCLQH